MMTAGIKAIKLAVKHMGNRGERVPVAGIDMCKRPGNSVETNTGSDLRIFIDVGIVVVIYKLMMDRLPENNPGKCNESNADRNSRTTRSCIQKSA